MKRLFLFLLILVVALSIVSCKILNNVTTGNATDGKSAYELAVEKGYKGTVEEWLASLVGEAGADGKNGTNGKDGANGKSAYELAVAKGYTGSEEEWLTSLIGEAGANGANGKSAYDLAKENGFGGSLTEWLDSLVGAKGEDGKNGTNGKSAYDLAKENGFGGSLTEWLASLVGETGADGKSAYELAVENGYDNDLQTWLASLVGKDGADGTNGKSAYDLAKENGYTGTEKEWLASLVGAKGDKGDDGITPQIKIGDDNYWYVSYDNGASWSPLNVVATGEKGDKGDTGDSAYEMYKNIYGYDGDENEWLSDLVNGKLATVITRVVTFVVDGTSFSYEVRDGEKIPEPDMPTAKEGYEFEGWFGGRYSNEKWSFIGYTVTENITLTAKFKPITYSVKYNLDASFNHSDNVMTFTVEDLPLVLNDPFKQDCEFLGWYTDSNYNTQIAEINNVGNITLYAKWLYPTTDLVYTLVDGKYHVTGYNGTKTDVYVPETYGGIKVSLLTESAFKNNTSITSVFIGDGISIADRAFYGCTSLTSVRLPNDLTVIPTYLFYDCTSLEAINMPSSVEKISSSAFRNCSSAGEINFSANLKVIGEYAFAGCSSVSVLNFPDGLETIDKYAFKDVNLITSLSVPKSVIFIGEGAFNGCNAITTVTLPFVGESRTATGPNGTFGYIFGYETRYAYDSNYSTTGYRYVFDVADLTRIPDSGFYRSTPSTSFYNYRVENSSSIKKFTQPTGTVWQYSCFNYPITPSLNEYYYLRCYYYYIPENIISITITDATQIPDAAFNGCSFVEEINLNDEIETIGVNAFQNCSGLTEIKLPDSVTTITSKEFFNCTKLTHVTISANVTTIAANAFNSCTALETIQFCGSEEEWEAISKNSTWDTNAGEYTIVYNYTKE